MGREYIFLQKSISSAIKNAKIEGAKNNSVDTNAKINWQPKLRDLQYLRSVYCYIISDHLFWCSNPCFFFI